MNQIKRLAVRLAALSILAGATAACVAEDSAAPSDTATVGTAEQHATGYLLDGLWYYKTDDFDEACGASKLSFRTGVNNEPASFVNIPRGNVTYVRPFVKPSGVMDWHCGTWTPDHDHSECDGPTPDWVRVWWDPNSRRINMKCFKKCSDGSSVTDCNPL